MPSTTAQDELLTEDILVNDLKKLGVSEGDSLVITTSLKSIGKTENGINTVLNSLLKAVGPEGSVFGLTFTHCYRLPLSKEDALKVFTQSTPTYTGTFNDYLLQHPSSIRSKHPTHSFVGIGPMALELLSDHDASKPAYEPVHQLSQYNNCKMLLLGTIVKCPGVTTVHVAQNLLKMKNVRTGKFGVNYLDDNNQIRLFVQNNVGGCSKGFWKFYEHYRKEGASSEGKVGNADSMLVNLHESLRIDLEILRENPKFFLCDNLNCITCHCTWEFSDKNFDYYYLRIVDYLMSNPLISTAVRRLKRSHSH